MLFLVIVAGIVASLALTAPPAASPAVERAVSYCKEGIGRFSRSAIRLQQSIRLLQSNDTLALAKARQALIDCRLQYKSISFFLEYFFQSETMLYNAPPKYEIEEPYMEYQAPAGLQFMESLLYEADPAAQKQALEEQADLICSSAADLSSLLYQFAANDAQLLESMRLELVRVITLYISGYDAPSLKSGIAEAYQAMNAMQYNLQPFLGHGAMYADSVTVTLSHALSYLNLHRDFDTFDRLAFITRCALPLQRYLGLLIRAADLEMNTAPVLNYKAAHLFSEDAFALTAFPNAGAPGSKELTELGRRLFFEKALSGNQVRSCASCHQPDKYFANQLARDTSFAGHSLLGRNTPTLLYACYQHAQFWDGKAKSLEEQVHTVLNSPVEMNANEDSLVQRLQRMPVYTTLFTTAFPTTARDSLVTVSHTAIAIAAFLRTLALFNSPFDRYIQGDTLALNSQQQQGFNLFMGKAQCGTCHFAPLFNGLTPPFFQRTEFEVLGTSLSDTLDLPKADSDQGRFEVFPISFYRQAFKTPTVRNAAVTAPYMHNGHFNSLEKVVDFYDKGGSVGLGLTIENQTLAAMPLHLTEQEKKAIIRFMEALTDQL
jgi:cytochrome c peroxidase